MDERRKVQREEVDEVAYIFGDGSSLRCTVKNISERGAAIELADSMHARPRFDLMFKNDRSVRKCRVIWSTGNRVGVEFLPVEGEESAPTEPAGATIGSPE